MANKLTNVTVSDAGVVTGTGANLKTGDLITAVVVSPVKAFTGEENVFYSEKDMGIASLSALVAGALVGEAYGHKRERQGDQSYLPIFR